MYLEDDFRTPVANLRTPEADCEAYKEVEECETEREERMLGRCLRCGLCIPYL